MFIAIGGWPVKTHSSGVRTSRIFTPSGSACHMSYASLAVT